MPDVNGVLSTVFDATTSALRTTGAGGGPSTTVGPSVVSLTNRSGTITAGGTAQNAAAANTSRKYLLVRAPMTNTEPLWFSLVGTATTASPSIRLDPGDTFVMEGVTVASNAVSVIAATTGTAFTCWEG